MNRSLIKKAERPALLLALLSAAGCATASSWVPLRADAPPVGLTLVWVGRGECSRMEGGQWVRRPEFDYEFSVEQRRHESHWESIKSLRRRHPAYDGSAGPRLATWYFEIDFAAPGADGVVESRAATSIGAGTGRTDREFREASLTLRADVSAMAPFDRYRIEQRYGYEAGTLTETVRLDKGDTPWVKNEERAVLFAAHRFPAAPTTARGQ